MCSCTASLLLSHSIVIYNEEKSMFLALFTVLKHKLFPCVAIIIRCPHHIIIVLVIWNEELFFQILVYLLVAHLTLLCLLYSTNYSCYSSLSLQGKDTIQIFPNENIEEKTKIIIMVGKCEICNAWIAQI